jgi:hypothetical protein
VLLPPSEKMLVLELSCAEKSGHRKNDSDVCQEIPAGISAAGTTRTARPNISLSRRASQSHAGAFAAAGSRDASVNADRSADT